MITIVVEDVEDGVKVSSATPALEYTAPTLRAAMKGFVEAAEQFLKPTRIREISPARVDSPGEAQGHRAR